MDCSDDDLCIAAAQGGLGVFAGRRFRRRELIGPTSGVVVHDPDYESDYCMEMTPDIALEPNAPYRYVNHSCRPNCEIVQAEGSDPARRGELADLWFETLSEIPAGDELTIDYGWPAQAAIRCRCGDPACRGWIVAANQLVDVAPPAGVMGDRDAVADTSTAASASPGETLA